MGSCVKESGRWTKPLLREMGRREQAAVASRSKEKLGRIKATLFRESGLHLLLDTEKVKSVPSETPRVRLGGATQGKKSKLKNKPHTHQSATKCALSCRGTGAGEEEERKGKQLVPPLIILMIHRSELPELFGDRSSRIPLLPLG